MPKKTWKVSQDAPAGVQITDESITIAARTPGDVNGVFVDDSGVYLRGKMSIMTMPEHIRIGGLWTQQSAWAQMLPSTLGFPNPNLVFNPSMSGITDMVEAVSWMMGMLV
jgi:hypothetical protein